MLRQLILFFHLEYEQGVKGFYWEGAKVVNTEIVLKLDPSNRLLIFETAQNRFQPEAFLCGNYFYLLAACDFLGEVSLYFKVAWTSRRSGKAFWLLYQV